MLIAHIRVYLEMIKALILDIDGVILGHKEGLNFPLPTPEVRGRLQNLSKQGVAISLCTVKAYFAVKPILQACGVEDNYHVTDAGATVIHGRTEQIETTNIKTTAARALIEELRQQNIYTEWYSGSEYFALPHADRIILNGRIKLLGKEAGIISEATQSDISKIIALPTDEWQTSKLKEIAQNYTKHAALHWGINPSLVPKTAAFFTHPLATKRTGVQKLSALQKISLGNTLAMGDSTNDWTFMELCGLVATLNNGSPELKELVKAKGKNGYVSALSVDENGVLSAFDYFEL